MLAHRVAEEIGVGIGELLVGHLYDAASCVAFRMGQESLRHARRRQRVDLHRFAVNPGLQRPHIVVLEHRCGIHEDAPVVQTICQIVDHCDRAFIVGKVALDRFCRGQGGGKRLCLVIGTEIMDHDVPAFCCKGPDDCSADPRRTTRD